MKKSFLYVFLGMLLMFAGNANAASLVSGDGPRLTSGNFAIEVDSDGDIRYYGGTYGLYEAATTSDTITAAESGKTFGLNCPLNSEFELPAATVGMNYSFVSTNNAATFSVDPNGTDTIKWSISNIPLDAGDRLISPGATGDSIEVFCTTANEWIIRNSNGTFTDGGA